MERNRIVVEFVSYFLISYLVSVWQHSIDATIQKHLTCNSGCCFLPCIVAVGCATLSSVIAHRVCCAQGREMGGKINLLLLLSALEDVKGVCVRASDISKATQ